MGFFRRRVARLACQAVFFVCPRPLFMRGGRKTRLQTPSPRHQARNAVDAVGQETNRAKNRTSLKMGFGDEF